MNPNFLTPTSRRSRNHSSNPDMARWLINNMLHPTAFIIRGLHATSNIAVDLVSGPSFVNFFKNKTKLCLHQSMILPQRSTLWVLPGSSTHGENYISAAHLWKYAFVLHFSPSKRLAFLRWCKCLTMLLHCQVQCKLISVYLRPGRCFIVIALFNHLLVLLTNNVFILLFNHL